MKCRLLVLKLLYPVVAKPITSVAELESTEADPHYSKCEVDKTEQGGRKPWGNTTRSTWRAVNQSSEQLTEEESQAVAELLHPHKDVFSLSEQDLSRTNLVLKTPHRQRQCKTH